MGHDSMLDEMGLCQVELNGSRYDLVGSKGDAMGIHALVLD